MTSTKRMTAVRHLLLAFFFALQTDESMQFGVKQDSSQKSREDIFQYYDTVFIFKYDGVTWDEAVAICPSMKANLAIVDTLEKAKFLAEMMSDSNIRIEDIWVGARQIAGVWRWVETGASLPNRPDEKGYPPWVYAPERIGKECMAMDRRGHDDPIFVDVSCKQPRSYICEKSLSLDDGEPRAARTVRYGDNYYTLYHGRLSWNDAVAYCRTNGRRLAVVDSSDIASVLSQAMTKSRPDFESAWIGGRFLYGTWRWAPTGDEIPAKMDVQKRYPPWRTNSTRKNRGCVLFDRHLCDEAVFIDSKCQRTRDFICEETHRRRKDPTTYPRFEYQGRKFELDPQNFTWDESSEACKDKGGFLAHITNNLLLEFITDLMSETGTQITHAWVGGVLAGKTWKWEDTEKLIPFPSNNDGFPPWCDNETRIDMPCLNLDRADHSRPMFYGLECNNTQPFVCEVDCLDPEELDNGTWHCTPRLQAFKRTCEILCDGDLLVFGSKTITCSLEGWVGDRDLPIAPQCVSFAGTAQILVDKLKANLEQSVVGSILFLIEDSDKLQDKDVAAEIEIASALVQALPLSANLRGGVLVYGSNVVELIPMVETDSCNIVRLASSVLDRRVKGPANVELALRAAKEQIAKYGKNERAVIVIMSSFTDIPGEFTAAYEDLYDVGHSFYVINFGEDVNGATNDFLKVASIGPDESLNYFSYNKLPEMYNLGVVILNQSRNLEIDCSSFWSENIKALAGISSDKDNGVDNGEDNGVDNGDDNGVDNGSDENVEDSNDGDPESRELPYQRGGIESPADSSQSGLSENQPLRVEQLPPDQLTASSPDVAWNSPISDGGFSPANGEAAASNSV